jgi:hypothetical protein
MDTANYLSCQISNETSSRSDFFGLNSYSWCGDSSYTTSGYDVLTESFANASLPVFFSEYGCNKVQPRIFTEVQALYGQDMTQALSGGLVYEWTREANDYGLIQVNDNNTLTLLVDYENLQKQYSELDINRIESANATQTSVTPVECSASLITTSGFLNTFNIPARLPNITTLVDNGISNANTGKLVSVSSTPITQTVYGSNGQTIQGITLNVLADDQTNSPGSNTSGNSSSSTGTTTASASSSTKTSSANTKASSALLTVFGAIAALAGSMVW